MLLLSAICSSVARADEAAEVADPAEALFLEGHALAKSNNYAEALTRFEESLRLRDAPKTVLYIVDCEANLGRRIHAARRLVAVFPRLGDQPELLRIAEQERDKIFSELAKSNNCEEALPQFEESLRLQDAPKTVLYIVECEAKLGRQIHAARRLVAVFPRLGDQPELRGSAERERDKIFGQIGRLEVRLRRTAAGVTVAVDGIPWAPDDKGALFVEPGAHRIVMRQPGHVSRDFTVQIAAGERFVREEEPLPVAPALDHRIIGSILTAVGSAVAVVSAVALANAIATRNDLDARCPPTQLNPCGGDPEVPAADARMRTLFGVAIGSGVLGVAGLTAGPLVLVRISPLGPSVPRVPQASRFELGIGVAF